MLYNIRASFIDILGVDLNTILIITLLIELLPVASLIVLY
jgi:hypothetical protein